MGVENKKRKVNKTYSMKFRFLATVILAIVAVTILIGGLSLYEVDQYIQEQAEDFVLLTGDNEAARINDSLSNMEKSVKIMESYLMDFFSSEDDVLDRTVQEKVIKSADAMFVDVARPTSTSNAISYYFQFDPAISDETSGLFYSKLDGSDEFISLEPTNISIYDKNDTEHVGWFWQPYEAGKPIWMKPYHNQNIDMLTISYVIPMYFGDRFIGVVGMDFDYVVLSEWVQGIELYENGFAHLEIDGQVVDRSNNQTADKYDHNSKKYLRTSRELVNGMTLVLSASYDDMWQIRRDITLEIIFVVLIISALFMAVAVFIVKKIVDPLKKLTDASIRLSNGDYDVEIADSNTYEIKLLSNAFENMTMRLREREELLHRSANRDSLTGIRNTTSYASWVGKFDEEIKGKNADFGVVVLDLNDLKATNDQYGHAVGNQLIVNAAQVILDVFKDSLAFRVGGDEFLVVLQNENLEKYETLLEQFDQRCADTFVEDKAKIPVGIARGYARFDANKDMQFTDVFKRADKAMYENKRTMKELLEV